MTIATTVEGATASIIAMSDRRGRVHALMAIATTVEDATASIIAMIDRGGRVPVAMDEQDAPNREINGESKRFCERRCACSKKASHSKCIWELQNVTRPRYLMKCRLS